MSNTQEKTFYSKPDFWHGDDESFTLYVKQAAVDIKNLIARPDSALFAAWGRWLAHVVLENRRGEAIEERSPWDYSTRGQPSSESFDLTQYKTVDDFLEQEFTGNTCATYCSGSGFAAETYADVFSYDSGKMYNDFVRNVAPDLFSPGELWSDDRVSDALDMEGVADYELEHSFRQLALQETFFKNMGKALDERNQERLQSQANTAATIARTEVFRQMAGTELPRAIEEFSGYTKWEWKNRKDLWAFLDALVEQYGPENVAAALMFVSIQTSKKVSFELKERYAAPT